MDYSDLSLIELKQQAKTRRIKQYYIMKRAQLIDLLSMKQLPRHFAIEKMTIHELREEAKRKGLRGVWGLPRALLVELLFPPNQEDGEVGKAAANKNQEDQGEANKHHEPEQHDSENVGVQDV